MRTRVVVGLVLIAGVAGAQSLKTVSFAGLANSNPTAAFDHGYVGAWDLVRVHSLTIYKPDGEKMFDLTSFKLPDGKATSALLSVDIDVDGTSAVVYAAEYFKRSGIAILNTAGKPVLIIQTEPFHPSQVCFAPDHSLWTFGQQMTGENVPASDFLMFRHYSATGDLLGSFIPRSTLPEWDSAGLDQVPGPFIGLWRLRALKDRLGAVIYLGPNRHVWLEIDFGGKILGQWAYTTSLEDSTTPVAFDDNGLVYGKHWVDKQRVGISVFDKTTSTWKPVSTLPNVSILGADGDCLVYQKGDTIHWIHGLNTEASSARLH